MARGFGFVLLTTAWVLLAFTLFPSRPVASIAPKLPRHTPRAATDGDGGKLLGPRGLVREAGNHKMGLTMIILLSVASCVLTSFEKVFVGELTQYCFMAQDKTEFWPRMRKVILVLLLSPVIMGAQQLTSKWTSKSIKLSLQTPAFARVLNSDIGLSQGAAASLITAELDQLTAILQKFLSGVVGCVIFSGFIWKLARSGNGQFRKIVGWLMLILVTLVGVSLLLQKRVGPAAVAATTASRQVANGVIAELANVEEIRGYNATAERSKLLEDLMRIGIGKELESEKQLELWKTFDNLRGQLNLIAIHFLLGKPVMVGDMPFAVYHAAFGLSINLAFSLRNLLQSITEIRKCSETVATINNLTAETQRSFASSQGTTCLQHKSLEVIDLSLQKNAKPLLQGISFTVQPGQLVAIVGASGSGKTTLLRAVAGRESECTGRIEGRGSVALLPQVVPMLQDTVGQNVAMHRNLSEEIICNCLRQANASDLIQNLSSNISDGVKEGQFPSGGQRQRIGLARASCGRPELLLLDEPTSALDVEAEKEVFKMLKRMAREHKTTILMVTHRVTLAQESDQVMVMKDGEMVQKDHHDVLKKNRTGEYYRLLRAARF